MDLPAHHFGFFAFGNVYTKDTILVSRFYLGSIGTFRQRKGTHEGTIAVLALTIIFLVVLVFGRSFHGNAQLVIIQVKLEIFFFQPRRGQFHMVIVFAFADVHRWHAGDHSVVKKGVVEDGIKNIIKAWH